MAKARKAVKIKWLRVAEMDGDDKTIDDVIATAGRILDRSEAGEMFGSPIFKGGDGKFYTVFAEAHVREVDKDYVDSVLGED